MNSPLKRVEKVLQRASREQGHVSGRNCITHRGMDWGCRSLGQTVAFSKANNLGFPGQRRQERTYLLEFRHFFPITSIFTLAWIRWIRAGKTATLCRLLWITNAFGCAQTFARYIDLWMANGSMWFCFAKGGDILAAANNRTGSALEKTMTAETIAAESELIGRILAGEQDLYYELIAPYERMAYVCALSIMQNEAEAEDCTQESFLKAFRHLRSFKGESKFGSWLVRITLNEAKMKLRKLRPQLYESLDKKVDREDGEYVPQALGDWREIPSEALERKEIREVLENAIKSLPEIYREIFALRDIQGVDVITSAQILGVSVAVVKTRLLRARLQLRDLLQPVLKGSNVLSRQVFRKGRNPWS